MNFLISPTIQIVDTNGKPLVGGKIYVYYNNTTNLATTYKDFDSTLNTNPIILDSLGHCTIIAEENVSYDLHIKDKNNILLFSVNNLVINSGSGPQPEPSQSVSVVEGNGIIVSEQIIDNVKVYTVANNAINPTDNSLGSFVLGRNNTTSINFTLLSGEENKIEGEGSIGTISGYNNKVTLIPYEYTTASGAIYKDVPQGAWVSGANNTVKIKGNCKGDLIFGSSNTYDIGYYGYGNTISGSGLYIKSSQGFCGNNVLGYYNTIADGITDRQGLTILGQYNNYKETYGSGLGTLIVGTSNNIENNPNPDPSGSTTFQGTSYSFIGGHSNTISGLYSGIVYGGYNTVRGDGSYGGNIFALGDNNTIKYHTTTPSYVFGHNNTVNSNDDDQQSSDYIIGANNTVNGSLDFVMGSSNNLSGHNTIALGNGLTNTDYSNTYKLLFGSYNELTTDTFLQISNGTQSTRKDILQIKKNDEIYYRYEDELIKLRPYDSDIEAKQDKLVAGKNITIENKGSVYKTVDTTEFPYTFTSTGAPITRYKVFGNYMQNGIPSPTNPVPITGVGQALNVIVNDTTVDVINFTNPIYKLGDSVDYVDFEQKKEVRNCKLMNLSNLDWTANTSSGKYRFQATLPNYKPSITSGRDPIVKFNRFAYASSGDTYGTGFGHSNGNVFIYVSDSVRTVDQLRSWLLENDSYVLYPLTTPETIENTALSTIHTYEGLNSIRFGGVTPTEFEFTYTESSSDELEISSSNEVVLWEGELNTVGETANLAQDIDLFESYRVYATNDNDYYKHTEIKEFTGDSFTMSYVLYQYVESEEDYNRIAYDAVCTIQNKTMKYVKAFWNGQNMGSKSGALTITKIVGVNKKV